MVDFNGFDKGVIGKKLPSDTTLNNMRKSDLIDLLHLAESNHRVLAETYKIAIDTSKCNHCPLSIDTRRAEQIRADSIDELEPLFKLIVEFENAYICDEMCNTEYCEENCKYDCPQKECYLRYLDWLKEHKNGK